MNTFSKHLNAEAGVSTQAVKLGNDQCCASNFAVLEVFSDFRAIITLAVLNFDVFVEKFMVSSVEEVDDGFSLSLQS